MEPRTRASGEQFATLLEYMESHGDLAKPQPNAQGRIKADRLWRELTNILNSIGGGISKPTEKWKKVWADWKSKTKKKALTISRHASGTGGGPCNRLTLSALETRVLGLIGTLAVEGHPELEELGFNTPSTAPPSTTPLPTPMNLNSHFDIVIEDEIQQDQNQSPPVSEILLPTSVHTSTHSTNRQQPTSPTPRRRHSERRRRTLTPFERAASQFVTIEQQRLEVEMKRCENEARMTEVMLKQTDNDQKLNTILGQLANIAEALAQKYLEK